MTEILMGHVGYLNGVYVKRYVEDLASVYLKHSRVLYFSSGGDLARRLAEQQVILDKNVEENVTLHERLTRMETDMQIAREVRAFQEKRKTRPAH